MVLNIFISQRFSNTLLKVVIVHTQAWQGKETEEGVVSSIIYSNIKICTPFSNVKFFFGQSDVQ
jgi:hypothetical protein